MGEAADALAKALSAEHAAVYAYGVVGGRTSGRLRARATSAFDAHRARRDRLRTLIEQRGGRPAEPGPMYRLPFEVRTTADAVRLAVIVEERLTTAYLELAADRDPALRRLAAAAAQECATRAYGWQPVVNAFPGMPQPAGASPSPATAEPATAGPGVSPDDQAPSDSEAPSDSQAPPDSEAPTDAGATVDGGGQ
ncbi:ferritin-like domain-containing protein [Microbispora sp. NPDC049125]|uniref:ferritin-like domain-containing protein n=1 Tax=Microbispora sp. NPDC049125 TaxID=3154929 RepID=UPI0034651A96